MNDKGFNVVAYNRTTSKVDDFLANEAKGQLSACSDVTDPTDYFLSQEPTSRVLTLPRSWSPNLRLLVKSFFLSRLVQQSMFSSISWFLFLVKAISSSTAETPITLILSVAPQSWKRKVFFSLAPVYPVVKRVLVMVLLSCPEDLPPPGLPSRKYSRRLPLRSMASRAVIGSVRQGLDTMSRWFIMVSVPTSDMITV